MHVSDSCGSLRLSDGSSGGGAKAVGTSAAGSPATSVSPSRAGTGGGSLWQRAYSLGSLLLVGDDRPAAAAGADAAGLSGQVATYGGWQAEAAGAQLERASAAGDDGGAAPGQLVSCLSPLRQPTMASPGPSLQLSDAAAAPMASAAAGQQLSAGLGLAMQASAATPLAQHEQQLQQQQQQHLEWQQHVQYQLMLQQQHHHHHLHHQAAMMQPLPPAAQGPGGAAGWLPQPSMVAAVQQLHLQQLQVLPFMVPAGPSPAPVALSPCASPAGYHPGGVLWAACAGTQQQHTAADAAAVCPPPGGGVAGMWAAAWAAAQARQQQQCAAHLQPGMVAAVPVAAAGPPAPAPLQPGGTAVHSLAHVLAMALMHVLACAVLAALAAQQRAQRAGARLSAARASCVGFAGRQAALFLEAASDTAGAADVPQLKQLLDRASSAPPLWPSPAAAASGKEGGGGPTAGAVQRVADGLSQLVVALGLWAGVLAWAARWLMLQAPAATGQAVAQQCQAGVSAAEAAGVLVLERLVRVAYGLAWVACRQLHALGARAASLAFTRGSAAAQRLCLAGLWAIDFVRSDPRQRRFAAEAALLRVLQASAGRLGTLCRWALGATEAVVSAVTGQLLRDASPVTQTAVRGLAGMLRRNVVESFDLCWQLLLQLSDVYMAQRQLAATAAGRAGAGAPAARAGGPGRGVRRRRRRDCAATAAVAAAAEPKQQQQQQQPQRDGLLLRGVSAPH